MKNAATGELSQQQAEQQALEHEHEIMQEAKEQRASQQQRAEGGGSAACQSAPAEANMAAAAPKGLTAPAGQAAQDVKQEVTMELRGSTDLEVEVAAMLSGMNKGAIQGHAPTDSAAPSGAGAASGEGQLSPGREGVPVLPDWVRNRESRKDLPMVCHIVDCKQDLSTHPEYYQRYRICKMHLQSPALLVDGIVQRFCQQCGRFHQLKEFDGDRRNCRARLQQHNSRRRKVSAIGVELRHGRHGGQQDPASGLAGLSGEGQPWQWPAWQCGPAAGSLLPLPLSNGSLPGLEPFGFSCGANGGLPPLPGLSLPLPPLPQPGVVPPPALASAASGAGSAYASAFAATTDRALAGHSQAAPQAPLTGSKRDYAAMLQGGSTLSAGLASGAAQQVPASAAPAKAPLPPKPSTPCLLLDRMAQAALAAAAQHGQGQGGPQWAAAGKAPPALRQHPEAQPLVSLFPQLADNVLHLSQQLQHLRQQFRPQAGASQLSVMSSGAKLQQAQASGPNIDATAALLQALLAETVPPQQATQPPARLPEHQDASGAAAATTLANTILANLQQQRPLPLAAGQQQPPQALPALAVQQLQPTPAASAAPSPKAEGESGGAAAPDAASLLRALLQKHSLQAAGTAAAPYPTVPAAPAAGVADQGSSKGVSSADAIQWLAAALLQPAGPAAGAPAGAPPAALLPALPAVQL